MNRRSMLSFLGIGAVGASTLVTQASNPVPSTYGSYSNLKNIMQRMIFLL